VGIGVPTGEKTCGAVVRIELVTGDITAEQTRHAAERVYQTSDYGQWHLRRRSARFIAADEYAERNTRTRQKRTPLCCCSCSDRSAAGRNIHVSSVVGRAPYLLGRLAA
jgi:hypothetical protein